MLINRKLPQVQANKDHRYQILLRFQLLLLCLFVLLVGAISPLPAIAGNGFPFGDYYNQSPCSGSLSNIPNCPTGNTRDTERFTDVPAGWFALGLRPDIVSDGQYIIKKSDSYVFSGNSFGTNFLVKNFTDAPDRDDPNLFFKLCASTWGEEDDIWEREYTIEWDNQHPELPLNYDVEGSFSGSNIIDAWPVSLTDGYTYTFTMSINSLVDSVAYPNGADLHLFLIKDTGQWLNQNDAVFDLEVHHATSPSASGEYVVGTSAGGNYVVVVVNNSASYEYLSDPRPRGDYAICIADSATPPNLPNLLVKSIGVSNPVAGNSIDIGFRIKNEGDADAAASMSSIAVDGVTQTSTVAVNPLSSGSIQYLHYNIGSLPVGSHSVTVCADAGSTVQEGDELDNCLQQNFTVQEAYTPKPDLLIKSVGPLSAVEGENVHVSAFVKNIGDAPAPASVGRVWVDQILVCDGTLNLDLLRPEQEDFTDRCNLGKLDVGTHTLTVCVNNPSSFNEHSNDNNCLDNVTITITPAPKPDLVVEDIYPLDVTEHQEFTLSVVVKNQGQANAPACTGKFFLNHTMIWYSPIPAIAAGASQVITMREGSGWNAGIYPLSFTADYNDHMDESVESNNALGVQIIARPRTVMVYPDGHGSYPTIQAGVDAVAQGGTVQLAAGTFTGTGNRDINFHGRNVNIRGADDIGSTIDCQAGVESHIAFILANQESQVKISNVRIINGGNEFFGGAMLCMGAVKAAIEDCIFADNIANVGGAIAARNGANLTIRRCQFLGNRGNTTAHGGAIHGDNATLVIYDSFLWKNRGAAISLFDSQLAIRNATFDANDDGIVLNGTYPALDIKRTIISNSSGQALVNTAGVTYYIVCSDFYHNSGGNWPGGPDASKGQISSDPLFCDPGHMDFSLHADSPCALATCGFMGAFPIGGGSASDTDNDGMDDDWERTYFGNLDHTGYGDTDNDGLSDDKEFKKNTNPTLFDTDHDGMDDGFEVKYDLDPTTDDAFLDADDDGACNLREYTGGTSPRYAASLPAAGIIHVSVAAIGNPVQVGSADLPFATIQQGVDMTTLGDTVLVHPGTYTGAGNKNILLTGKGITLRSSDGYETTIIDCENNGRGITIGGGTPDSLVVDGFTVTHGNYSWGAGLYIRSSNPTVKNCSFDSNQTITGGGGVGMWGSSPTFANCLFRNNTAHQNGGAVHVELSYPLFENCEFSENLSAQNDENLFGSGGAIYAHQDSQLLIITSSFWQNSADTSGGAVATVNSDLYCVSIKFVANNAVLDGGGIYCEQAVSPDILNSLFLSNSASYGGGLYLQNTTTAKLVNLTFSDNSADGLFQGGCIYMEGSDAKLQNSIYWSAGTEQGIYLDNSDFEVGYSDGSGVSVGAGSSYNVGAGNLDADPLLTSDGHLSVASPCIDRGGNEVLPADQFDLDGDGDVSEPVSLDIEDGFRIWPLNGISDMGAMEYAENGLLASYSTSEQFLEGPLSHGYSHDCISTDHNLYQGTCIPLSESPVDWAFGNFSVEWTGYLFAPVSGSYTISSHYWVDGIIHVEIDGQTIADIDTGGGGYSGQVTLEGGYWVPVTITFASNGGSNNMVLGWTVPGKSWSLIPRRCLIHQLPRPHVADFDNDGTADILWHNVSTGAAALYFMGVCGVRSIANLTVEDDIDWQIFGPGDFNADGIADILWINEATSELGLWSMNTGSFSRKGIVDLANFNLYGPADFNGDGCTDLLWRHKTTGQMFIWYLDEYGYAGSCYLGTVSDLTYQIYGPADFNGDGIADIIWRNSVTGVMFIWYMNTTGLDHSVYAGTLADADWVFETFADFDGDGNCDIYLRNHDTGQMVIWHPADDGHITSQYIGTIPDMNWQISCSGDFNGDGNGDIIWRNVNTGVLFRWTFNDTGYTGSTYLGTVADTDWRIRNR